MSAETLRPPRRRTRDVDLSGLFDNTGFSAAATADRAAFNVWSNSLPVDEVPWSRPGHVELDGLELALAATGAGDPDNLRCSGQFVPLPPGEYDWIHVLAAAERRTEDIVWLHFDGGAVDPEWLRVSDFWPETSPWFGERACLRFSALHYPRHVQPAMGPALWLQRVPVTRRAVLRGLRLPDNPAIHLFAMALSATDQIQGDA